jgi:hypothetical protein
MIRGVCIACGDGNLSDRETVLICRCVRHLVVLSVAGLTVLGLSIVNDAVVHGRASHASLVAGAVAGSGDGTGGHFSVTGRVNLAVALPEGAASGAGGVVVLGAWAETLLGLVVLGQRELHGGGDEEEEDVEDGHGEAGSVQGASIAPVTSTESIFARQASADRSIDNTLAGVGTVARVVGDGGETADEAEIEEDGDEGEEGNAAEAESEKNSEDGVENGSARHALNGLFPCWNADVVLGEDGQVVAVDAQDDGSSSELDDSQASLAETEDGTTQSHCVCR